MTPERRSAPTRATSRRTARPSASAAAQVAHRCRPSPQSARRRTRARRWARSVPFTCTSSYVTGRMLAKLSVLLLGLAFAFVGNMYSSLARRMRSFKCVAGRVIAREVVALSGNTSSGRWGEGGNYTPQVTYRYVVDGVDLQSNKIGRALPAPRTWPVDSRIGPRGARCGGARADDGRGTCARRGPRIAREARATSSPSVFA